MIVVPEAFVRYTVEREGAAGAAWIAELPGVVDELLERWGCVPDGAVMHGGVGVVVPVRRRAEGPAVLKVSYPHPGNVHEPDGFAAWGGRGAVLLYERDDERFAMLLERVRSTTLAELEGGEEVARVAGRISRRLAVPAPPGLPRLADQAEGWEEQLRKDAAQVAHSMPQRLVDAAVATVRELGRSQPHSLVHGDLHPGNILRADREPWLAVDPKGYVGDPGYDGGTLLKTRALAFLAADDVRKAIHHTVDVFAEAAELDRARVRRWAQFRAVEGALWGHRHGFRIARGGAELARLTAFAEHMAELLMEPG